MQAAHIGGAVIKSVKLLYAHVQYQFGKMQGGMLTESELSLFLCEDHR